MSQAAVSTTVTKVRYFTFQVTMATPLNPVKEALKKIDAQLECPICFEPYTEPKLLPCFHVFCKHCLDPLVVQDRNGPTLCCPNCRRSTTLPPNGVSGLQSDFHVDHLFEIRETLEKMKEPQKTQCEKCEQATATGFCHDCGQFTCDKCTDIHQFWKEFKGHQIVTIGDIQAQAASLIPPKKKVAYCPRHPEKVLEIYCETDGELICTSCTVRLHKDHQYDVVTDTFPKHRDEILSHLQPVRQNLDTINKALQALDTRTKEITDQRSAIEADIHKRVNQLLRALEQRRTELIGQLDQITQHKLGDLAAQRDKTELLQAQFSSCLEYIEGSLTTGTEEEILAMKTPVVKHIQGIIADFNPDTLPPRQDADILLIADDTASLTEACHKFADVTLLARCYAVGDGLKAAMVGERATVTVHAVGRDDMKSVEQIRDITAELVCVRDGSSVKCEVKKEGEGMYGIVYQPATRGKHQLHIRINGKKTMGSPHDIVVMPDIQKLGTPTNIIEKLDNPGNIAINSQGQVVVAEGEGHCITVLTLEGKKIRSFGKRGTGRGEFTRPRGVAIDRDDNIIVADHINHRIQKFTSDGRFILSIGTAGSDPLQFNHPSGIGLHPKNGKLYVCDEWNHRIQVLENNLTFHSTFGTLGSGNGQLKNPADVVFDSSGNLYIAEFSNHRVQVFTPEGVFLRKFGTLGRGSGQLNCPIGIVHDRRDRVYVSELKNNRISIFTDHGKYLASFGSKGNAPGQFDWPWGITVDGNGYVIVADHVNDRTQIF